MPEATTHGSTLYDRCARIELLVLDVDGVLTDGSIIYGDGTVELKAFFVRDGVGLRLWQQAGKRTALLTGRTSPIVERRAAELGMQAVFQGLAGKGAAFRQALAAAALKPEQACAVGDDLPDLPVLVTCGLAVAVADACPEVKGAAHYVTRAPGGRGAVRETVELILASQGRWLQTMEQFRRVGAGG
jgi:YrbI family 3-deoxy-D-manno-octulosonate 8-phosphate phosphatase